MRYHHLKYGEIAQILDMPESTFEEKTNKANHMRGLVNTLQVRLKMLEAHKVRYSVPLDDQ